MKQISIALGLALLFAGCAQNTLPRSSKPVVKRPVPATVKPVIKKPTVKKSVANIQLPTPPKKNIKLREIDDKNFNADYMYPKDEQAVTKTVEKTPTPLAPASVGTMSKEECIGMISQEKFDKYTTMFGSEASAIKRCTMLKAVQ